MKLHHVVITMVNRDELADGGATDHGRDSTPHPRCGAGDDRRSALVGPHGRRGEHSDRCESHPEIMSHNLETVRRLTPNVRSRSTYERSLDFLRLAKEIDPDSVTKSSLMLGLGETRDEVLEAMDDLLASHVSLLNLGQYLQPTRTHLPVQKYWTPEEFAELKERALEKGFTALRGRAARSFILPRRRAIRDLPATRPSALPGRRLSYGNHPSSRSTIYAECHDLPTSNRAVRRTG